MLECEFQGTTQSRDLDQDSQKKYALPLLTWQTLLNRLKGLVIG